MAAANGYPLISRIPSLIPLFIVIILLINIFAGAVCPKASRLKTRILHHGNVLLRLFVHSLVPSILLHLAYLIIIPYEEWLTVLWSALFCIAVEAIIFWNGIICVYLTSFQLGIKQRVIGIICGMIPIANLIALAGIIKTTKKEALLENEKDLLNASRRKEQICATKYPILMVHGVFFRDFRYFNYWGRIPYELTVNGASVYYGNHESASSVADSAAELSNRIKEIVEQTGCEKVNIIAHSKGGLDCRYAIERLGMAPYIASLTTINTPHRGCLFADYLLNKIPQNTKNTVANTYNKALRKLGDKNPDFLAAVTDLTAESCQKRSHYATSVNNIFCQSVGSVLRTAGSGKFPLNFSYYLVKYFDGENDGLVSEQSFSWGEKYTLLKGTGKRGISHGDMIDLNRENIEGFDVREFYVNLVVDLKKRGL